LRPTHKRKVGPPARDEINKEISDYFLIWNAKKGAAVQMTSDTTEEANLTTIFLKKVTYFSKFQSFLSY